jgi:hypothetical protein
MGHMDQIPTKCGDEESKFVESSFRECPVDTQVLLIVYLRFPLSSPTLWCWWTLAVDVGRLLPLPPPPSITAVITMGTLTLTIAPPPLVTFVEPAYVGSASLYVRR